ncbi:hypothetical protein ACOI1C_14065 [Bacillus sp. DJP31]|uniref:hypothetical protein n=1 Tax=Bacillus sp. DJP31 TaxID=3409789 RepID=UPI003BB58E62
MKENTEDNQLPEEEVTSEEEVAETTETDKIHPPEKKNKKKLYTILGASIFVLFVAGILVNSLLEKQAAKKEFEAYKEDYTLTLTTIKSEVDKNLEITGKTHSTWHDAIFNSDTDTDFNVAIMIMYLELESNGTLQEIKDGRENIEGRIADLKNPPDEFENLYLNLLDYYSVYTQLNELAIEPTGNINSFGDLTNSLETDASKQYNRIKPRIPEEMKD